MKEQLTELPTSLPVSVADVRRHLVLDHYDDDELLEIYLGQAAEYCQARTGVHIGNQKWTVFGDVWCDIVSLPYKPVDSVSISYYAEGGDTLQVLDPSEYILDNRVYPATITYTNFSELPKLDPIPNRVECVVTTGYTSMLPKTIEAAIYLITGHLYERREDSSPVQIHAIPMGAEKFLQTVKLDVL